MKFLYHLVLALLLLASLAAGTVAAVWHWAPERVVALDETIVRRYEQETGDELVRLQELAEESPAEALPQIRALVDDLEPYEGSDRRLPQRMAANRLLIGTLVAEGETEEALTIARQFAAFNSFDHTTRRWVANQFLLAGEPHRQEGVAMLATLFEQFPEDPVLARMLATTLSKAGDGSRAVEVALAHLKAIPAEAKSFEQFNKPWLYSAAVHKADLAKAKSGSVMLFDGITHLIFTVSVPLDVRSVSMTVPFKPQAAFGVPAVSISRGQTREFLGPLTELTTEVRNATLDRQGLVLDGRVQPTIIISLPEPPTAGESLAAQPHEDEEGDPMGAEAPTESESENPDDEARRLRRAQRMEALASARLIRIGFPTSRFPRWIEDLLLSAPAAPMVAAIKANSSESLQAQFFAERVSITRAYGMAFRGPSFHVNGQDETLVPSTVRDDRYATESPESASEHDMLFEGGFTVEDGADTLDLKVPAVVGAVVELIHVDWVDSAEQAVAAEAISSLDPLQLDAVEGSANTWRVLPGATNPTLRISRPKASGLTCQLKGGLR